jgi:hypothetical protein
LGVARIGGRELADFVAMIAIETEPGELIGSLANWYEWRHPRWTWSQPPPPLELTPAGRVAIVTGAG